MENRTNTFFSSISTQTIVTISSGILEMVVFSILSRLLTRADFGYFAVITALVTVFKCFSEAGFGSAIIQKKEHSEAHISTAFTLSVSTGLVFSLILFLTAPLLAKLLSVVEIVRPLRIMSVILLINSLASVGNAILTRKLNFLRIGIIKIASYVISASVAIFLATKGAGLYSIVTLHLMNALLCVVFLYTTSVKFPHLKIYRTEIKKVISFGGWYTGNVFMNSLIHDIDKFVLPKLLSVEVLGAYTRPTSFVTNLTSQVNSIFDTVLFPMLSGIQDDINSLKKVFAKAVSMLNVFSFYLSLAFFINADLIILIFFGSEWKDLVPIMRIISISVIFNVDGRLVDCFLRSMGEVKLSFELRIFAFFVTLVSVIVGSKFGVVGIAVGAVLSNILIILSKLFFLVRKINISYAEILVVFFRACLPSIPIIVLGLCYFTISSHPIYVQILTLAIFISIVGVELLFFPGFVGKEYTEMVYPKIKKLIFKKNEE